LVILLLAGISGCNRTDDKITTAPRTESPSSISGWTEVATSGVAIQFPNDWKLIDLASDQFAQREDKAFGNDPKLASIRAQVSAAAKQGMIKFMAFETATIGTGFATNCNLVIQDSVGHYTLEQVGDASVQQMAPLVAAGSQSKIEYVNLKAGRTAIMRSEIKIANPSVPLLVSLGYINLKNSRISTVTFTAPIGDEAKIRKFADKVMDTFHYTN